MATIVYMIYIPQIDPAWLIEKAIETINAGIRRRNDAAFWFTAVGTALCEFLAMVPE